MANTQRDYRLPSFKEAMHEIGLEERRNYLLGDDGNIWSFQFLKCDDEQYQKAHELLATMLNS